MLASTKTEGLVQADLPIDFPKLTEKHFRLLDFTFNLTYPHAGQRFKDTGKVYHRRHGRYVFGDFLWPPHFLISLTTASLFSVGFTSVTVPSLSTSIGFTAVSGFASGSGA